MKGVVTLGITKKMLKDYAKIKREIPLLRAELEEMQHSEFGLGSSIIMDYSTGYPRPQAVIGFDHKRYERRKAILANKEKAAAAVEAWIDEIEDTQTRLVFKKRYIQEQKWIKIAKDMGFGNNIDYARVCIRDEYLKKCNIK